MTGAPSSQRNLLVSCGGKWVGMILQLRQAVQRQPLLHGGSIVVASSDALTPAGCFADATEQVPPIKSPDYIDRLLEVCQKHDVRIVVPLIDVDLERLSGHLERFAAIGVTVVCATRQLIELCLDKLRFEEFCRDKAIAHARFLDIGRFDDWTFPVFYKRRRGFGSIGSGVCKSVEEARELVRAVPDTVFQELILASEASVDAYISSRGECIVCVPRTRDKVVGGEAYKTTTLPAGPVAQLARRMIAALADAGLRGPLNVQIFETDPPSIIEANPRLGSASVLSNMAVHGRLLDAMLSEALGNEVEGDPDDYVVGLSLSRFLGDVFHKGSEAIDVLPH